MPSPLRSRREARPVLGGGAGCITLHTSDEEHARRASREPCRDAVAIMAARLAVFRWIKHGGGDVPTEVAVPRGDETRGCRRVGRAAYGCHRIGCRAQVGPVA